MLMRPPRSAPQELEDVVLADVRLDVGGLRGLVGHGYRNSRGARLSLSQMAQRTQGHPEPCLSEGVSVCSAASTSSAKPVLSAVEGESAGWGLQTTART